MSCCVDTPRGDAELLKGALDLVSGEREQPGSARLSSVALGKLFLISCWGLYHGHCLQQRGTARFLWAR